jgi:CRISPR-associated protein Cas8a1/Csx13
MAKEIVYKLTNPGFTVYHRAALGGLAATVRAWGKKGPDGIKAEYDRETVRLSWGSAGTDQEALRSILQAAFKLDGDKMIELPGQAVRRPDLRLAIHNGITGTFLQHPKMRPGEKQARRMEIRWADDEAGAFFSYKAIDSYAHQKAQGTGLLDPKWKGALPAVASIPQSVVPGAMSGALDLQAAAEDVILLLFLMVGVSIFHLRPRTYKEKAQYCVIVPDVTDLARFAQAIQRIATAGEDLPKSLGILSNTYGGRIAGGLEEAALRFLLDLHAERMTDEPSVSGCLAVAMGRVSWDSNQINRSLVVRLRGTYPEIQVFRAAEVLGKAKIFRTNKGEGYAIPGSPIPELVAANLAADRPWVSGFSYLTAEKKDFQRMRFWKGGLVAMRDAIENEGDKLVIKAFQEAWKFAMRALYERERTEGAKAERLLEVERERMRNAILRAKTPDMLASWFLRFCADSTKGAPLPAMQSHGDAIRKFIFNPRNFDRFQNLCLFSLVSYSSSEKSNKGVKENDAD